MKKMCTVQHQPYIPRGTEAILRVCCSRPQGSDQRERWGRFGPTIILYTSEMFELLENRQYAYADYFTLMTVVRMPSDIPNVAASLNRELARIQEWCNHWCLILNPFKTKASVVSRSRTVNPLLCDLVLSAVYIRASRNRDILGV